MFIFFLVKKVSKRRGDICAKVQLVLYPPDPCLLLIRRNERKKKAKAAASGAPRAQPTLLQHVQKAGSVVPR